MKALNSYEGIHRIEQFMFYQAAFRGIHDHITTQNGYDVVMIMDDFLKSGSISNLLLLSAEQY